MSGQDPRGSQGGFTEPTHPQPPVPGAAYAPPQRNGMGTASLVLGIVAVVLAFIPVINIIALILAVVGMVLGILGFRRVRRGEASNRSSAMAGMILSGAAAVLSVVVLAAFGNALDNALNKDSSGVNKAIKSPAASSPAASSPADTTSPEASPADEPAAPAFAQQTYRGRGDKLIRLPAPISDPIIAVIRHTGESNFVVDSKTASGTDVENLVNEIGTWKGTKLLNVETYVDEATAAIQVQADGRWTITLKPLADARRWDGVGTLKGTGSDVVITPDVFSGLSSVQIRHRGESNFIVSAYGGADIASGALVNEIGNYSGEVVVPADTAVLSVTADGSGRSREGRATQPKRMLPNRAVRR